MYEHPSEIIIPASLGVGRASAAIPLAICGYTGHPKEVIWIEGLVLTVAVHCIPLRGFHKKRKGDAPSLGITHLD